jgi:D-lactate dehydrogenase (cytochrome)
MVKMRKDPMPTHRVMPEDILGASDYHALEALRPAPDGGDVHALAVFLEKACSLHLERDADVVAGYVRDQSNLPGHAGGLVRPAEERECAFILAACSALAVPVRISAGTTTMAYSATPEGGVILSLERMLSPGIVVDAPARTVTCGVGFVLEDMRRAVLEQSEGRLFFPVDPTSRCEAMVGGALSCNASGFTPGERGAMRPWVRGLRLVTADGRLVRAERGQYLSQDGGFLFERDGKQAAVPVPRYPRPAVKNAGGPFSSPDGRLDLVDLVVGSEGIFALITGCTLGLAETPSGHLDLFCSLPDEDHALQLLSHLRDERPGAFSSLSACEYFGHNCRRFMDHEQRLFRRDHRVGVYLQAALERESLESACQRWLDILQGAPQPVPGDDVLVLTGEKDGPCSSRPGTPCRQLPGAGQQKGTHTIMTDTVVPAHRFGEFLAFTHDLIRSAGIEHLAFGHLGDCHLHFMIMPERYQLSEAGRVYDRIIEKSSELGGVYSGEHGTGRRKRADFLACHGRDAAGEVLACKMGLDPRLVLNPGNVVECAPPSR